MGSKLAKAFYDPGKTYDDNFDDGPTKVLDKEEKYINSGEPSYSFLGKKVYSPFGIPAGPLLNSEYVRYAFEHGFDVIVYKTQRSVAAKVNAFPNVLFLDIAGDLTLEKAAEPQVGKLTTAKSSKEFSITNSFGNPSRGPEYWMKDFQRAKTYQGKGQLLIMSVCGTIQENQTSEEYYADFARSAKLAADAGAEAIELNLSCPNVANEGVICYTPEAVIKIAELSKKLVGNIPLIAKFGYFSGEQQTLLEKIIKETCGFFSAYSAINTIATPVVDEKGEQALPGPNRLKSGVCGASIKWAGLDMVKRLADLRNKLGLSYEIIGVGGVMSPEDFKAYRKAGADVVQSATAAMWNPGLATEIKSEL